MTFQCIPGCKAECCGLVPTPKIKYRRHKREFQRPVDKIYDCGNEVLIATKDLTCVFLDSIGKCAIYNDRPLVCRQYGIAPDLPCPYVRPDGTIRPPDEVLKTKKQIEEFVESRINALESKALC